MSSSISLSKVPEFFYSTPLANFQETNYTHSLDIDELLATCPIGLATARTLKKWRRLTQSARQRLLNARIAYAADRCSMKNIEEFRRVSVEVVSIPSSLYNLLAIAKATDETHKGKRAAKKAYKERCAAAIKKYKNSVADAEQEEQARRRLDIDPILGDNDSRGNASALSAIQDGGDLYQIAVKAARDSRNKELEAAEDAYFTAYVRSIQITKYLGED